MIDDVGSSFTEKEYFSEGVRGGCSNVYQKKEQRGVYLTPNLYVGRWTASFFCRKRIFFRGRSGCSSGAYQKKEKRGVYLTPNLLGGQQARKVLRTEHKTNYSLKILLFF